MARTTDNQRSTLQLFKNDTGNRIFMLVGRLHRVCVALAAALMILTPPLISAVERPKAKIFVAMPIRDGFVDATEEQAGPARALESELKYMSEFTRVSREADADLVVTIIGRGIGSQALTELVSKTSEARNATVGSMTIDPMDYWVVAVLTAGPDYRRVLVGATPPNRRRFSAGPWSDCTTAIAKDLRAFVRANGDRIWAKPPNSVPR